MERPYPSQKCYVLVKLGQGKDGRDSRYFSSSFQPKSEAGARRVKLLARLSWGHPLSVPAALS